MHRACVPGMHVPMRLIPRMENSNWKIDVPGKVYLVFRYSIPGIKVDFVLYGKKRTRPHNFSHQVTEIAEYCIMLYYPCEYTAHHLLAVPCTISVSAAESAVRTAGATGPLNVV